MERKTMNKEYNFTVYTDADLSYFLYTLQLRKCIIFVKSNENYTPCSQCKCRQACDEMEYLETSITKEIEKRSMLNHVKMRGLLKK